MKHIIIIVTAFILGCQSPNTNTSSDQNVELSSSFKDYWYDGNAEISCLNLTQSRHG